MENGYLIVVDTIKVHPNFEKITWEQEDDPQPDIILEKIRNIALEKQVPLDFLERYGFLCIESFDNNIPFEPHTLEIVFPK